MTKPPRSRSFTGIEEPSHSQVPARPAFGFLLGGTTLGIFFGCILLCAGAGPPEVILILLSIFGAFTGGILESFWPKPLPARAENPPQAKKIQYNDISVSPFREDRDRASPPAGKIKSGTHQECQRCGEVFPPLPVVCPMCGHSEQTNRE